MVGPVLLFVVVCWRPLPFTCTSFPCQSTTSCCGPLSERGRGEGKAGTERGAEGGGGGGGGVGGSVSVSDQDGIVALGKAHTRSAPSLSSLPKFCPRNSAYVCLVEHRSFPTLEGGMSTASFLHSSFLQAINAVMLWPVHVQNVHQAS